MTKKEANKIFKKLHPHRVKVTGFGDKIGYTDKRPALGGISRRWFVMFPEKTYKAIGEDRGLKDTGWYPYGGFYRPQDLKVSKTRQERLMPEGVPRYIRCYDNGGETADPYTVVFTGNYSGRNGICRFLGMSDNPFYPQGVCQHGEHNAIIDRPKWLHLGKKISFEELPADCRKVVIQDYKELWGIE
jgi:hypothetical protein